MLKKINDLNLGRPINLGIVFIVISALTGCGRGGSSAGRQANRSGGIGSAATQGTVPIPPVGNAARGKILFAENCFVCHGKKGQGVRFVGQDLQASKLVMSSSAAKLVAFIKHGRSVTNPINHRHIAMPPFGGNAALTNQDLYDIVAYLRKLQ